MLSKFQLPASLILLLASCATVGKRWEKVDEGMSKAQVMSIMDGTGDNIRTFDDGYESWYYRQYCVLFKDGKVLRKEKTTVEETERYVVYSHQKRKIATCEPSGERPTQDIHSAPFFHHEVTRPAGNGAKKDVKKDKK